MKIIENKQTDLNLDENSKAKYSDLIKILVDGPINTGITISEMSRDMAIIEACKSENAEITLTDEQFEAVKDKLTNHTWRIRHVDLVKFYEHVTSL